MTTRRSFVSSTSARYRSPEFGCDPEEMAITGTASEANVTTPMVTDEFKGMRITPNVYTTVDEVDLFADRVIQAIRQGVA
jgi:hypothetical protein